MTGFPMPSLELTLWRKNEDGCPVVAAPTATLWSTQAANRR